MSNKWYLYFISCGSKNNRSVKIGIAKDPTKRILDLQIGNPQVLKLDSTIECRSRKHAHNLEHWLHKCFSEYHIRGEWFKERYLNVPRALAGFQTNVELQKQKGKGIHGSKSQDKIQRLHSRNVALEKTLNKMNDHIDEELDKITLAHLNDFT